MRDRLVFYCFIKLTTQSQTQGTHTFHEERYSEEIDFLLINKDVNSALRDSILSSIAGQLGSYKPCL